MSDGAITLVLTQAAAVNLILEVEAPITLQATQSGLAVGPKGDKGDPGVISFGIGERSSATDAGTFGNMSLTDDYMYVCTQTGTAGNAIWKKMVMFQT